MRIIGLISILFGFGLSSYSQITGGQSSFAYLQATNSAKVAGIGGDNVSSFGDDPTMVYKNPALLNERMYNKTSINIASYTSGVKLMSAQHVFADSKIGSFSTGITYLNYGVITRRNEGGANEGEFYANDFVIHGSKAFSQDNFSIGFTPKIAYSQIEKYSALAFASDIGGTFNHPTKDLVVGMTIQNVGFAMKNYTDDKSKLPFSVTAGFSAKPKHMPLKISITAHHLQQFDIVYDDPSSRNQSVFTSDSVEYKVPTGAMILRHFTVGGELIFSKNFNFRIGYNFQRRRELRLDDRSGGAGFSFGFMMKVKSYQIDFTKVYNNYAGRPLYLTVHVDFDKILKRKVVIPKEENI